MQAVGPAGFYNVPVTKFLILVIGSSSILTAVLKLQPMCHLQLSPHITAHHQFWRLITSHIAFANSGDVFFGSIVLYTMRVIERQFGSAKYASFVFLSLVMATLLEVGALVSAAKMGLRSVPGGPFALLFSMLYQYYRIVPATYHFRVFGLTLNDKIFIYTLALQIFLSQGFSTMVPCTCGLLAGALYRSDVGNIKKWRFPRSMRSFADRFINPLLLSQPLARPVNTTPSQRRSAEFEVENLVNRSTLRNRRNAGDNAEEPTIAGTSSSMRDYIDTLTDNENQMAPPPEEHIETLRIMFPNHPVETITRALESSHNDLSRAAEIMLSTRAPEDGAGSSSMGR